LVICASISATEISKESEMRVDELRRGLDDAGRRPGIDLVEARAAVGAKSARRRRRNHQLFAAISVVVVAAVAIPVALMRDDPGSKISVAAPSAVRSGDWTAIRKTDAGLVAGSSLATIASTDHSLLLGGMLPGGRGPAIWYSDDAFTWKEAAVPTGRPGSVHAIAASGSTVLAIGSDSFGRSPFVWRSQDDGRSWHSLANGGGIFGPPAPEMGRPFVDGMNAYGMWIAFGGASSGYAGVVDVDRRRTMEADTRHETRPTRHRRWQREDRRRRAQTVTSSLTAAISCGSRTTDQPGASRLSRRFLIRTSCRPLHQAPRSPLVTTS
jgi:hypothetical protein